jgi:hypothetical protein
MCLHVDDGLLTGGGEIYDTAKKKLFDTLRIKHVHRDDFVYLKRRIVRDDTGNITIAFDLSHLAPITLTTERKKDQHAAVTEAERTQLRTLIGALSWPIREGYPELGYDASDIQQRICEATVGTILRANACCKQLKFRAAASPAFRLLRGDGSGRLILSMMTDASWNRQPRGGSQQGYVLALGDRSVLWNDCGAMHPVAWASTKIKRVVRSTLAAEAAALATGYDAAIYVRVFVARMLGYGADEWVAEAKAIPQISWIDCKSLKDMLHKEGSVPSEKRVALDIYDIQQYLVEDDLEWCSTARMLADPLTKPIPTGPGKTSALAEFLRTGLWDVSISISNEADEEK